MSSLPPLEILFFPFPSPGHYLPLLDIAALVASRGANATVVINPAILSRLSPSILRTANLHFHSVPFPSAAAGLPDDASTADAVPANLSHRFAFAISLLREPFAELLSRLSPSAVISDSLLPFTAETAASLNIPWFSFPGTGLFALSIDCSLFMNCPEQSKFNLDSFSVPGLPDRIELARSQLKETTLPGELTREFFAVAKKAEEFSSGVVVNSFAELEPGYAEHYRRETKKRVFSIGPVSAIRREEDEKDGRIANWLTKKTERSVVYVCFGSLCHLPKNQILEIGRGLEDSGVAFLWVIREPPASSPEVEEIEERVGDRGMIVRGWITGQSTLLRHSSIGGFLTHCGWGAVTEAAAAGVPMLTWPMFGEQFYNEKLVNEVAGIGVEIGTKEGFVWGEEEKIGVLVGRERISERVRFLMADSATGFDHEMEGVRKRVKEMKEKARKAMDEGGSSYGELDGLLEHCRMFR